MSQDKHALIEYSSRLSTGQLKAFALLYDAEERGALRSLRLRPLLKRQVSDLYFSVSRLVKLVRRRFKFWTSPFPSPTDQHIHPSEAGERLLPRPSAFYNIGPWKKEADNGVQIICFRVSFLRLGTPSITVSHNWEAFSWVRLPTIVGLITTGRTTKAKWKISSPDSEWSSNCYQASHEDKLKGFTGVRIEVTTKCSHADKPNKGAGDIDYAGILCIDGYNRSLGALISTLHFHQFDS